MSKPQSILLLLLCLIILFSIDIMFGNPIRDTFHSINDDKFHNSHYKPIINKNKTLLYSNSDNSSLKKHDSDDEPLFFGFST